ncbi:MAG: hypothetical protein H7Z75_08075 [Ferruginibacter sp.]|nr:hypothetical protein [Cytophagales bacterium]
MDAESLDNALIALVDKRIELNGLKYSDDSYDKVEEELHDMEDDFVDVYGKYLEKVLEDVHEKYCSNTEVLLPTAYVAKKYIQKNEQPGGKPVYEVSPQEGVWVDLDGKPGQEAHLVLVPSPARILLMIGTQAAKEVWRV